jgi:hypothetical protein
LLLLLLLLFFLLLLPVLAASNGIATVAPAASQIQILLPKAF